MFLGLLVMVLVGSPNLRLYNKKNRGTHKIICNGYFPIPSPSLSMDDAGAAMQTASAHAI